MGAWLLMAAWLAGCDRAATPAGSADGAPVAARRVRLLNREEYRQTVLALFPSLAGTACESATDCALAVQDCVDQTCTPDACEVHTFVYPAASALGSEVVVAGSFNGWAGTAAAGGLRMTWSPETGQYWAKTTLGDGTWEYKIVIDGATWLQDTTNPASRPDGFGGQNSVVVQACDGAAPPSGAFDPTAGFLPDTRPEGFPFDTHADAGVVNAVRVEGWLAAGEAVADRVLQNPGALLGCDPNQEACVRGWLTELLPRAFRRPVTTVEVERYVVAVLGAADRTEGLQVAVQGVLSSPELLYRPEVGEGGRLNKWETASALSYWLWSAPPDEALTAAGLAEGAARRAAAARLLDDPRADAFLGRFVSQWLGLEPVGIADRSEALYGPIDGALRAQMVAETEDVFAALVRDGGTLRDLYTADWTIAGPAVRALYGLPSGDGRVTLPPERAGVLSHASLLFATSHSDQSSPIRRGLMVRTRLLCETFPAPPPTAGGVPDVDPTATTRERFAQHTDNPACASCHDYIDGLGFGFEHFDAVGAWRETENGAPIDATGLLRDVEGRGTETEATFESIAQLGAALAASEAAPRCLTAQVVRYALGVEVAVDDPRLDGVVEAFAVSGYELRALLLALAESDLMVERAP
jgi:hypothetical protein